MVGASDVEISDYNHIIPEKSLRSADRHNPSK
jgi:hypothetical protein